MLGVKIAPVRLLVVVGLFCFLLGGIYALLSGYILLEGAQERKSWAKIGGTIVRSEVIGERAYRPNIVYSYTYHDTTYIDSTSLDPPSFGTRAARLQKAQVQSAQFHPGDSMSVYVDPNQPSHSTLHYGATWDAYGRTGTGVFFILGALIALGWMLKHPPTAPKPR